MISHGRLLCDNLIVKCMYLMQRLDALRLIHEFRKQNRVANTLAKEEMWNEVFDVPTALEVPSVSNKHYIHIF